MLDAKFSDSGKDSSSPRLGAPSSVPRPSWGDPAQRWTPERIATDNVGRSRGCAGAFAQLVLGGEVYRFG
jgi:hypothetical protein